MESLVWGKFFPHRFNVLDAFPMIGNIRVKLDHHGVKGRGFIEQGRRFDGVVERPEMKILDHTDNNPFGLIDNDLLSHG